MTEEEEEEEQQEQEVTTTAEEEHVPLTTTLAATSPITTTTTTRRQKYKIGVGILFGILALISFTYSDYAIFKFSTPVDTDIKKDDEEVDVDDENQNATIPTTSPLTTTTNRTKESGTSPTENDFVVVSNATSSTSTFSAMSQGPEKDDDDDDNNKMKIVATSKDGMQSLLPPQSQPNKDEQQSQQQQDKQQQQEKSQDKPGRPLPNIILIVTDQQNSQMMSNAGTDWIDTPAMDYLARHGKKFTRAYTTNPVCVAARVGFMTGRFPSVVKRNDGKPVRDNKDGRNVKRIPSFVDNTTLGKHIKQNAPQYQLIYGGKEHLPKPLLPLQQEFQRLTLNERDELAQQASSYIKEQYQIQSTQSQRQRHPYFMWLNFINPHDVCYVSIYNFPNTTQQIQQMNQDTSLELRTYLQSGVNATSFLSSLSTTAVSGVNVSYPPVPDNYDIQQDEPKAIEKWLNEPKKEHRRRARDFATMDHWLQYRYVYARLTEHVDRQIQVVLDSIVDWNTTLLIFTSDHGDLAGSHRLGQKNTMYEESTNIPLIVVYNNVIEPNTIDDQHLVSNGLDLLPTICDYAGIPSSSCQSDPRGTSLRPLLETTTTTTMAGGTTTTSSRKRRTTTTTRTRRRRRAAATKVLTNSTTARRQRRRSLIAYDWNETFRVSTAEATTTTTTIHCNNTLMKDFRQRRRRRRRFLQKEKNQDGSTTTTTTTKKKKKWRTTLGVESKLGKMIVSEDGYKYIRYDFADPPITKDGKNNNNNPNRNFLMEERLHDLNLDRNENYHYTNSPSHQNKLQELRHIYNTIWFP